MLSLFLKVVTPKNTSINQTTIKQKKNAAIQFSQAQSIRIIKFVAGDCC